MNRGRPRLPTLSELRQQQASNNKQEVVSNTTGLKNLKRLLRLKYRGELSALSEPSSSPQGGDWS